MRHLDLCSGIGGFALAARWMGWETVGFAEIDEFASRVLEKHWPGVPNYGDIATIPDGVRADLVTAGLPCQPWSLAGKRLGYEDDRAIWPLAFEVIRRVQPRYVVLENVVGFIGLALDGVLSDLEAEGYEVGAAVLPACSVNAPHRRDRVWIIAHCKSEFRDERFDGCCFETSRESGDGGEARTIRRVVADPNSTGRIEQRQSFAVSEKQLTAKCGHFVSHPAIRPDQQSESRTSERALSGCDEKGDGDVSDSDRQSQGRLAESRRQRGGRQLECGLGGDFARLPAELDRPFGSGPEFWDGDWERGIPRVVKGVKDRAKRLKALGNSIVPQVAYRIFRAIEDLRS